jgi:uncharacterized protein (DUF305 family)
MTRTTVRRALLAGAASAILLLAGCGSDGMNHGNMESPSPGLSGTNATAIYNDADVMFSQMMIPHHQQAVEMAALAETRAQDPELRQLAAAIKSAQQPEITTMTNWLTAWGKPTIAPSDLAGMGHGGHGGMPGMMSAEEMTQLAAANGIDFDRIFARMMIAHHQGALMMAETEVTDGSNPDAIALAKTILKTQLAEIVTLQQISDRL